MANAGKQDARTRSLSLIGTDEQPALGFIELSSISRGLYLTDAILKKAPIRLIASQPISSGKHVLLYTGDVASVEESHALAVAESAGTLLKEILIPGVHEELAPFLNALWTTELRKDPIEDTLSIIESQTLSGAILAADAALKTAQVHLVRMRLGQGIGGKAYFVLTGPQSEVEAATETAQFTLSKLESLCRVDLIPQPTAEALVHF